MLLISKFENLNIQKAPDCQRRATCTYKTLSHTQRTNKQTTETISKRHKVIHYLFNMLVVMMSHLNQKGKLIKSTLKSKQKCHAVSYC